MHSINLNYTVKTLPCVLCSLLVSTAHAQVADSQGLDLAVNAGLIWSDNITLAPADEDDGTIGQVGLTLRHNAETRRVRSDIGINTAYQHYLDDEFDDDVVGGLNGTVVFGLIPERFEWLVQDNFGQSRVNVFESLTPGNRQNVNYFTTGPDLTLRLGAVSSLRLGARYSLTDYEATDLDSDRNSANVALIRQFSAAGSLSLNGMAEQIKYDDPVLNNEYDRQEAYLRYAISGGRTDFSTDLGGTRLDDEGEASDGLLLRLSLRRGISPSSSVRLNLSSEFADSASAFRANQDLRGVELDPDLTVATTDPFENRVGLLGWDFNRNRTRFGVSAQYTDQSYETLTTPDRTVTRYDVYAGRQLASALSVQLDFGYIEEEFEATSAQMDELAGGVSLTGALGRTLSWELAYRYRDRAGSGLYAEYTENRASFTIAWAPLQR